MTDFQFPLTLTGEEFVGLIVFLISSWSMPPIVTTSSVDKFFTLVIRPTHDSLAELLSSFMLVFMLLEDFIIFIFIIAFFLTWILPKVDENK
ncbi:TPA: hypothetical protein ACN343_002167 [Vibrio parahaemolyticus]|nr:hypothetical protein [Vibrio parahaemolyticus]EJG1660085.1 hypothetical protein [Vibrio parahaemolyticus]EJG1721675.1 hypothetical protein [Vibrio parahaemolyticus]EJG1762715.1 hypothetical protein [Vibrio parahaemolyticus]ELB1647888.1 hypothetical protein [Vibrio parahaemolyticus]ELB2016821.1 hypothetical protein [Vibrio parahaemolyticus]